MSADLDQPLNLTDQRIWRWWQQGHGVDHMVRKLGLPTRSGLRRVAEALKRMPEGWDPPRPAVPHAHSINLWADCVAWWNNS